MSSGTRRRRGVVVALVFGALSLGTTAGLATWEGPIGVDLTAAAVFGADVDGCTGCVAVDDERLGVVEVMESVGSCDVGADEAGDVRVLSGLLTPAPAQPASTIERAAAPARERPAYR